MNYHYNSSSQRQNKEENQEDPDGSDGCVEDVVVVNVNTHANKKMDSILYQTKDAGEFAKAADEGKRKMDSILYQTKDAGEFAKAADEGERKMDSILYQTKDAGEFFKAAEEGERKVDSILFQPEDAEELAKATDEGEKKGDSILYQNEDAKEYAKAADEGRKKIDSVLYQDEGAKEYAKAADEGEKKVDSILYQNEDAIELPKAADEGEKKLDSVLYQDEDAEELANAVDEAKAAETDQIDESDKCATATETLVNTNNDHENKGGEEIKIEIENEAEEEVKAPAEDQIHESDKRSFEIMDTKDSTDIEKPDTNEAVEAEHPVEHSDTTAPNNVMNQETSDHQENATMDHETTAGDTDPAVPAERPAKRRRSSSDASVRDEPNVEVATSTVLPLAETIESELANVEKECVEEDMNDVDDDDRKNADDDDRKDVDDDGKDVDDDRKDVDDDGKDMNDGRKDLDDDSQSRSECEAMEEEGKATGTSLGHEKAGGASSTQTTNTTSVVYRWLDEGELAADGRLMHQAIELTVSKNQVFVVRPNDTVRLWSSEDPQPDIQDELDHLENDVKENNENNPDDWDAQWIARVTQLWEMPGPTRSLPLCRVRWFYTETQVEIENAGVLDQDFANRPKFDDDSNVRLLVLSDHHDDNDIGAIRSPFKIFYRTIHETDLPEKYEQNNPNSTAICRFVLHSSTTRTTKMSLTSSQPDDLDKNDDGNESIITWVITAWNEAIDKNDDTADSQIHGPDVVDAEANFAVEQVQRQTSRAADSISSNNSSTNSSEDDGREGVDLEEDDGNRSTKESRRIMPEGEGSQLRGNIQIGEMHQVTVGPFVSSNAATLSSRSSKPVWTPGKLSDQALRDFLDKLAQIHTTYLKENALTFEEPYSPLRTQDEEEELLRLVTSPTAAALSPYPHQHRPMLTGSSISTVSSLVSIKRQNRNGLLKECNVEAVLELLHDCDYDTEAALSACRDDLKKITNAWTRSEKELFDTAFRNQAASSLSAPSTAVSLRDIAKSIHTKTYKEIIDYWFRFKVADQFRLYQNKKREQAIRMVECIEKRRYHELATGVSTISTTAIAPGATTSTALESDTHLQRHKPTLQKHFTEIPSNHLTNAAEIRRQAAKTLLLNVQETMGSHVMQQVAATIRELSKSYNNTTKKELFTLLKGHDQLQQQFLDFLPKNSTV